jgi:acyl-CoA thioesterase I
MKNISKHLVKIFIALILLLQINIVAQNNHTIKVICVGNSITFGSTITDREKDSYPAVLGKMLGSGYEVKNYGLSGRTILKKGNRPYWNEPQLQEAVNYNPDIVIIKLGTNDSKPANWQFKSDFEKDYSDMVELFKNLTSKPKVFICNPVPAYANKFTIRDSIIVTDIIPSLKTISKAEKVDIIDFYGPFAGKQNLLSDGVHPNTDGAKLMAKIVFKVITGKEYVEPLQTDNVKK